MATDTDKALADAKAAGYELDEETGELVPTGTLDDEEEEEAERDEEPEPLSMERAFELMDEEAARHVAELQRILGPDWEAFHACELCDGQGIRPVVAMPLDPDVEGCGRCQGHGYTATGAVREDRAVRECTECMGNGYVQRVTRPEEVPVPVVPVPMFDPFTGLPIAGGGTVPVAPPTGAWAPGYVPPGTGNPSGYPPR